MIVYNCNAGKEKGIPIMNIFCFRMMFSDKTICELCFCLLDEMEDITFSRSMCIIIDILMDTVMEYFHITEVQLEKFTASSIQRLPKYMQEALERKEIAA